MSVFAALRQALLSQGDVLLKYRNRIAAQISLLAVLLLIPFTLANVLAGKWLLAVAIFATQVILSVNLRAIEQEREPVVPFEVLLVVMTAAICTAVHALGVKGVFWAYPGLFIIYFVVDRRLAFLYSVTLIGVTTGLVFESAGIEVAVRVGATLVLTMLMINVVINVIGELQSALLVQTITDPLTGAFNRRHFDLQLQSVTQAAAGAPSGHALLAIDIDHFKRINDCHGHDVGDRVLQQVVTIVQGRKRAGDQLFRTGGEEFMLLLPGISQAAALHVAEELRQRVAQAELLPGEAVTVSIGVSMQRSGETGSRWIKRSDEALYRAKNEGRDRVALADDGPLFAQIG